MAVRLPILSRKSPSSQPDLAALDELAPPLPSGEPAGDLFQIGDLARTVGKTVRAIHLYEELDLLRPAARSKGRFRLYAKDAIVRIRWIGKLQDMGFSLTDIQTIVRDWEKSSSAPRAMVRMREVYKRKLTETKEQLSRLAALEHELTQSLEYLDTCDVCEPDRLLHTCRECDHHEKDVCAPELVAGIHSRAAAQ